MNRHIIARHNISTEAYLLSESELRHAFPLTFDAPSSYPAFPDQLHTFVGDCSSKRMMVTFVPRGDVLFTSSRLSADCIIAVLPESVRADYLDYLEEMQVSYIFAGADGMDLDKAMDALRRDFGIYKLSI